MKNQSCNTFISPAFQYRNIIHVIKQDYPFIACNDPGIFHYESSNKPLYRTDDYKQEKCSPHITSKSVSSLFNSLPFINTVKTHDDAIYISHSMIPDISANINDQKYML